jgi:transposase-like protein
MASILTKPYFIDEAAAFAELEAIVWPNGPTCPHCGAVDRINKLATQRTKASKKHPEGKPVIGLHKCYHCRGQFTVRKNTVFEASHIELHVWFQAAFLMCSSKKGVSSNQLHRTLGVTLKTAWFMSMRLREAMRVLNMEPMGGANKVVEADETYVGGKAKNMHASKRPHNGRGAVNKEAVFSLVEREGRVRSYHVASVNAKTLRPILDGQLDKRTHVMTDESSVYPNAVRGFAGHSTVNHGIEEYVRGGFFHTNTIEGFFSVFKRGIVGTYHHVSPTHLKRYLAEFDFRYNERQALGINDLARTEIALRGIIGKRLTYRDSLPTA